MNLSERIERVSADRNGSRTKRTRRKPTTRSADWAVSKRRVRDVLIEELGSKLYAGSDEDELGKLVASNLDTALRKAKVSVSASQRSRFVGEVTADLLGYGPLDEVLADDSVTEVMCNGHDDIYVERQGKIAAVDASFDDEAHFRQVIEKIVGSIGRRIDEAQPYVDARLPDGSRVNAVLPPIAVNAPVLTIRRFPAEPYEVKDLVNFGTLTVDVSVFIEACVRGKLNVLISGGTGTGKTTLLNVASAFIPEGERIITIEDAAELRLHQPHVVSLEARPANIEGAGEITIRDLVRNALRMRPDRIVVGEVRGAEALDMLQAMNTGHEGSLTTVHSNSPRDAISRIETMVLMAGYDLPVRAIRQQIASAIDIIVHLDRFGDGSRHVTHVTELQGLEGDTITLQDIFKYAFASGGTQTAKSTGKLLSTGLRPKVAEQLRGSGVPISPKLFRPSESASKLRAVGGRR